jgi:hypothetical protein
MSSALSRLLWLFGISLCLALAPLLLSPQGAVAANPASVETVDMFKAMDNGDIDVRFVPKDSREAKLTIRNKTDRPLNVKLPEAFAGVPVLAQVGGGAAGGAGAGGGRGAQGVGAGGGAGFGCLPPQGVAHFKVPTVCLEHGKAEPRSSMAYQVKPIESFTDRPAVKELCCMLGAGQIDQRTAQAATWHLNNDLSWEQLAGKRTRHANGSSQPYFTPKELMVAVQVAARATKLADEHKTSASQNSR